jgi:hypothetical protein
MLEGTVVVGYVVGRGRLDLLPYIYYCVVERKKRRRRRDYFVEAQTMT